MSGVDPTVWVAAITGLIALTTTVVTLRQNSHIDGIKAQVKNSHNTNLRDDIDGLRHEIERVTGKVDHVLAAQQRQERDIAGFREDLRQERWERLALSERFDQLQ